MTTNEGDIQEVADVQEEVETLEEATTEEQETTDWKAKYEETQARLKRAETKLEKSKIDKKVEKVLEEKNSTLDETQLDYLDLKGISDPEEVELVHNIMLKSGKSLRETLKDDYVLTKLSNLRKDKEKLDATPGATRRSGGGEINTVDYWYARYEQTGQLPKDFALRSEVINRKVEAESTNKPSWRS